MHEVEFFDGFAVPRIDDAAEDRPFAELPSGRRQNAAAAAERRTARQVEFKLEPAVPAGWERNCLRDGFSRSGFDSELPRFEVPAAVVADGQTCLAVERFGRTVQHFQLRRAFVFVQQDVAVTPEIEAGLIRLFRQAAEFGNPAGIRFQRDFEPEEALFVPAGPDLRTRTVFFLAVVEEPELRRRLQPDAALAALRAVVGRRSEQPELLLRIAEQNPAVEELVGVAAEVPFKIDPHVVRMCFERAAEPDSFRIGAGKAVFEAVKRGFRRLFHTLRPESGGTEERLPVLVRCVEADAGEKRGEIAVLLFHRDGDAAPAVEDVVVAVKRLEFGSAAAGGKAQGEHDPVFSHGIASGWVNSVAEALPVAGEPAGMLAIFGVTVEEAAVRAEVVAFRKALAERRAPGCGF